MHVHMVMSPHSTGSLCASIESTFAAIKLDQNKLSLLHVIQAAQASTPDKALEAVAWCSRLAVEFFSTDQQQQALAVKNFSIAPDASGCTKLMVWL